MFLLFFNILIIIMNQILLYKVNVCLKRYYKCTLFGLIFLMVIILGIVYMLEFKISLSQKFNKSFKKVVALALQVINDEDSDEGNVAIVLGEVELVREILLNRYQKFLSYEKEQLFLKKLRLIENELRMKMVAIKRKAQLLEMQEEKTRSRGR